MNQVTQLLQQIEQGQVGASEELLPLVYEELRKLARHKLADEKPGQTLQATALVHDAYLRLVDSSNSASWNSRGHFFMAAAEAMRRILVEKARRKRRIRHGGGKHRVELEDRIEQARPNAATILAVNDALTELTENDGVAADIVKLHFFSGLTLDETADVLTMSRATVYRHWAFGRAFLKIALSEVDDEKV